MQSDGGLCTWDNFSGLRAILSGPAGGVVGYSKTCYDKDRGRPLIAVDMGGTSTDVSRYAGKLEHVFETTTAEGESAPFVIVWPILVRRRSRNAVADHEISDYASTPTGH